MLHRFIHEDWQLIFPLTALLVAALVFLSASWRAWRMKPAKPGRLWPLPPEHD